VTAVLDTRLSAARAQLDVVERAVGRRRLQLEPIERQADSQRAGTGHSPVTHVDRRPTRQVVAVVERKVGTRHVTS